MITLIRNRNNVVIFFRQLIDEGTNAHPDEDFHNYINTESGDATYTGTEAGKRNSLMKMCFEVCEELENDICDLMQEVYSEETGLNI